MIDVRRLRVLSEVAACGSFSGAAVALRLDPVGGRASTSPRSSARSACRSSSAGRGPSTLTEAGHALTRHAAGIFARLDGAEQELEEIARRRHGRLRFGSVRTALATVVPPAFVQFRRRHPEVTLTVVDEGLPRLLTRIEAGELDLALIYDHHEALPETRSRRATSSGSRCSTIPSRPSSPPATGSRAGAARSGSPTWRTSHGSPGRPAPPGTGSSSTPAGGPASRRGSASSPTTTSRSSRCSPPGSAWA